MVGGREGEFYSRIRPNKITFIVPLPVQRCIVVLEPLLFIPKIHLFIRYTFLTKIGCLGSYYSFIRMRYRLIIFYLDKLRLNPICCKFSRIQYYIITRTAIILKIIITRLGAQQIIHARIL